MKTKYRLIFMSFDGSYITDFYSNDLTELQNKWENIGSKWIFYPFGFILSGNKIIETGQGLIRMSDKKSYAELMFKGRFLNSAVIAFSNTNNYCNRNDYTDLDCYQFEHIMIDLNPNLIR